MNVKIYPINFMLKSLQRTILFSVFFFFLAFSPQSGFSQTACTNVYWTSGWCTMCSGSSYSCNPPWSGSGNWNNGIRNFSDPIPGGNVITSVSVTVNQADCGYGTLCVYINGVLLQCKPAYGNCNCGSCWPMTFTYSGALPGYNYGGTNSIQLTISGGSGIQAICVSSANICFNYAPSCVQSGAPSSASASPNPTCGGATTLSVAGGSLGTGASWFWYSGACGGTFVGNGASISVTPGSSTTYFVRAQGNCNTTACASVAVNVNSSSVAAQSASASPNPICSGATTLSVVGGSLGTGASWNWFSGSCGGTFIGTGASISVSPGATTNYFVRAQGTCNTTSCAQVTVTVNTPSTDPSSASASPNSLCGAGSTTLTVAGGSLGTGAFWNWYAGSCSGTFVGAGASITVSPSATTTYFVKAQGTCNTTNCVQVTVTVSVPSVAPVGLNASVNPTCGGVSTLSVIGGSLGAGASWNWFSGTCGGTPVGTGASINVSPSTSTNYFVRAQGSCNTTSCASITLNVNNFPVATASPSTQNICSGNITNIALTSSAPGTTFNWTVSQSGVTGGAASSGSTIAQTLSTTGPSPGTAVYTITPTAAGCTGNPITVTITVNPIPIVTANPLTQTLCTGSATAISLASNVSGTTFSWTISQSAATGAAAGSGASIAQTLSTTGSTTGTVTYLITPSANGCSGTAISVTITIYPKPIITATPASQTFCSGGITSIGLQSSVFGTSFSWTVAQSGVTGASGGSGSSISQTLTVNGNAAGTAVYTITPTANSCVGTPITVTITVNPMPTVIASPAAQTICSGNTTSISLSSPIAGTTFAWTVFQNNVTGATAGTGANIAQILTASVSTPGTVSYIITPTVGTCVGTPLTVNITVNPGPNAIATPSSQTFCSGGTSSIALSSSVSGTTFTWTVAQTGVSGAAAGSGPNIVQTLIASGTVAGTAVYAITPTSGTCVGAPISLTITVNPIPIVIATPASQIICSGDMTGINLTSNVGGTTFSWTANQANATGSAAGTGNAIAQTLTATGSTPGTVVYTVTQTSGACVGFPITVNISVNKKPIATASPAAKTICSGTPSTITLTSNISGTTYTWTAAQSGASGAVSGSGSSIAQTLSATGSSPGLVTYTIIPTNNGCNGDAITATVTINPRPVVTATPASQTICTGGITSISLLANVSGSTFSWTVNQTGVSGASAGSGSSIIQTLSATGSNAGTAVYTITPTASGCAGNTINVTINVNPIPVVTASPIAQTICSGTASAISLTSNVTGTTFAWTVAHTNSSGGTSGSGNTIAQSLTALSIIPGTAVYTVTPTAAGCIGLPIIVTITVNPKPIATASPNAQTICSGTITSINLNSNVVGTTFAWTTTQSGVTGSSAGNGATIGQTLTASGPAVGTAVYTVTPTAAGCAGSPITINVDVNPKPIVVASPSNQTICSGNTTFISLTSAVIGTTYSWIATQTNVTGALPGSGANVINQVLTLTGSTAGTAVYTVTPIADGCPGNPITVNIAINVNDNAAFTYSSSTYCKTGVSNPTPTITGLPGGSFSSSPAGLSINAITGTINLSGSTLGTYAVSYTSNGICPITTTVNVTITLVFSANFSYPTSPFCQYTANPSPSFGVGASAGTFSAVPAGLNFVNVNTGQINLQTSLAGTYTITNLIAANGTCAATSSTSNVTISPSPNAIASPSQQTICTGDATAISLSSSMGGTSFSWTVTQSGASGASAGSGASIAQSLTADGTLPGTVLYTITPTSSGCTGLPISATVTVNQRPVVTTSQSTQTICSGGATSIALTGDLPGTTFAWTVSQSGTSGATASNGATIAQTITATGITAGTATYTVTPTAAGCAGTPISVTITVKPTPITIVNPVSQTICSGTASSIALTSNITGTTFVWTVVQTGVSGASSGGGNAIAQNLTATGTVAGTATYSVIGTVSNCPGPPTLITVTVNPRPVITATPASQTICSGLTTSISLSSNVIGTTFSWTATQTGVTGATSGSDTTIAQILSTASVIPGTATYTIKPTANGCVGDSINVIITVNPKPIVTATPVSQVFCSGGTTGITISSNVVGTTFSWTVNQTNVSGATAGIGAAITQILTATGALIGTAIYTITPSVGGCAGQAVNVTITVNPIPVTTAVPASQTICSGTSSGISLTNSVQGATFSWVVLQNSVTGAAAGTGNSIAQILSNSGISPGNAVYTISTTANGCVGNPITSTVTVNPRPIATATPAAQTICSSEATSIQLASNISITSFSWTVVQTGVSGAAASSGAAIVQTLSATGNSVGTAVYTITPSAAGCDGTPISVSIDVKPTPVLTVSPSTQTICSGDASSITLSSNVIGTTFGWTVSQSLATGGMAGNGSLIAQTLTASTINQGIVTYTIVPTAATCVGLSIPVGIFVNPRPKIIATPAAQTICSYTATSIVLTSDVSNTSYSWTVSQTGVAGASTGSGSSIVQTLSATGSIAGTAVYTITPNVNNSGCSGSPIIVTITVNPIPLVTATPPAQTICSGITSAVLLTSDVAGATFSWTVNQTNVIGASTGSDSVISQTLSTTGTIVGTAIYTITPTASSCVGSPISLIIQVNPIPNTIASPSSQTICSGNAATIILTSDVSLTTYAWTVTQNNVTGAIAGSGSTILQNLSATTAIAGNAIYSITPTSKGCSGSITKDTVTVNPRPVATASPATQTFCTGGTTSIALSSNVLGTSFSWTRVQTGVTGAIADTGSLISQTLSTTGTIAGTVVYTITPSANACGGTPITVTITVNPKDKANFNFTAGTYCQTGANPTPTITGLPGGTFSSTPAGLSINSTTGLITLATSAVNSYTVSYLTNGICPNTFQLTISIFAGPLANFSYQGTPFCQYGTNPLPTYGPGASAGTFSAFPSGLVFVSVNTGEINLETSTPGTYTITNTIVASGGCAQVTQTFSVVIGPAPVVTISPTSQTICSGDSTSITLTSSMPSTSYAWTVTENGIVGATNGITSTIIQTLLTTGMVQGTALYSVIPTSGLCIGKPKTITVKVNPIPIATAIPSTQTICSGTATSIELLSTVIGTTFTWTATQNGAAGATAGAGATISQVLTTLGDSVGQVVYTIIPSASGCLGAPIIVTLFVNPIPAATASPSTQTLCSGEATSIAFTSSVIGTSFTWTVSQSGASGASDGNGTNIIQTLTSTFNTSAGTVTYAVTPNAAGCSGTTILSIITVNPRPIITATTLSNSICSGTATSIALSSNIPGTTFSRTVIQTGVSGASAGTSPNIVQTLMVTGFVAGTAVYTITPTVTATGCTGTPITVTITVTPSPVTTASPSSQTICSGSASSIALSSNIVGTTFSWTATQNNVSGATADSGSTIAQTLMATGNTAGTAVYIITPSAGGGGCQGNPISVMVKVKPIPVITATPSALTICSGEGISIYLSSNVTGTTFAWTVNETGTSGAANGSGSTISQTLLATSYAIGTTIYTVTPTATGCAGIPYLIAITVNPLPDITASPSPDTICTGVTTSLALSSNVFGSDFSWTSIQTDITGATPGSGTIISQTLINTSYVDALGIAVYTITPIANGCLGSPIKDTVIVRPKDKASFAYSSGTFCQGANPESPTITGLPGGIFSSSPSGLVINTLTGLIDFVSSALNTYTISYTTNGYCPNINSINMTVTLTPSAVFNYIGSPFCQYENNPFPIYGPGASAGFYSATPAGLVFANPNTGEINLPLSTPGFYTVKNTIPASGLCLMQEESDTITVSPAPVVTATPSTQTICSGSNTSIFLSSTIPGTTYTWTVIQMGVTGTFDGSYDSIVQTLTTAGTFTGSAMYTITPTSADGCIGLPITLTVTVGPCPIATAIPSAQVVCSGDPTLIGLSSNLPGTTFSWTVVQSGVTGAVDSSGSAIAQTLFATDSIAGSVVYTVTPNLNGCAGIPLPVTIVVYPVPTALTSPTSQTICSGNSTSIALTSNIPSSTFSWTASQLGVSGGSDGAGDSIMQILTATGTIPGIVTYTITPIAAGACPAVSTILEVTVRPKPDVIATPSTQVICSGNTTSIDLNSNLPGTVFYWTVSQTGVTGGTADTALSIYQTLTDTTNTQATAVYTVTPLDTATGCSGTPTTVTLIVNPSPVVTATPTAQTICSGLNTSISLSSSVGGTTYSWTVAQSGVTGAVAGSGNTISQLIYNSDTITGTAVYTITPLNDGNGCNGNTINVTITVNPIDNPSFIYAFSSFCITGNDPSAIILGLPGGIFSSSTGLVLSDSLTGMIDINASPLGLHTVKYTTNGPCPDSSSVNLMITAAPTANFTYPDSLLCQYGVNPIPTLDSFALAGIFTSNPVGLVFVDSLTGEINLLTSIPGTYLITNTTDSSGGCALDSASVYITIQSLIATATSSSQTICSGDTTSILLTGSLPATTFSWAVAGIGVVGAADGTDSIISQVLFATDSIPGIIIYTITPTSGICIGNSINDTLIVNPSAIVNIISSSQNLCSGDTTSIQLSSNVAGTTFSWTVSQTGVSGASPGNDSIISQVLTATGNNSGIAVYTITPTGNGCAGLIVKDTITVNPIDDAAFAYSSASYCISGNNPTPTISGLPGGVFSSTPIGLSFDSITGTIDLLTSLQLNYTIIYTTNGICPNSNTGMILISDTTPSANFSYLGSPFCKNGINPSPTFAAGASGGIFSAFPSGLVFVNINSGVIDLTLSSTGTYTITNKIPTNGNCDSAIATYNIVINTDDASFIYPSATYCQSGTNPTPTITGLPGGTFSSAPLGLVVDGLTGVINLSTSTIGNYILTYSTNGTCPNSSFISITITNTSPSANFSYTGAPFCINGSNPLPVFALGSSAGVFSAIPSGLIFAHVNTGEIDLSLSLPGTYTVINFIPQSGNCIATSETTTITINADDASFSYSSATYCNGGSDQSPIITGLIGGVFSVSPTGLAINPISGTINLATSNIGSYALSYTTNGTCPFTSSITMTIDSISPSATFSYLASPFCPNADNPLPVFAAGSSAGIFSSTPAGLEFTHINTGEINLESSLPGVYLITNTIPESGNCLAAIETTTITISTLGDASFSYPSATYCISGSDQTPIITGVSGGVFSSIPVGLSIDSITGSISLVNSSLGSYTLSYSINDVCENTSSITMTIKDTATSADFTYSSASFCQYGSNPLPVFSFDASAGIFSAYPSGLIFSHVNTGEINLQLSTPGNYFIVNNIPSSGSCLALADTFNLIIDAAPIAIATPGFQTFCSDGLTPISVALSSSIPGTSFIWNVNQTGISGANADDGLSITDTLSLTGLNQGTAIYSVIPTANGCIGNPTLVNITLNPAPVIGNITMEIKEANCFDTAGSIGGFVIPSGQSPLTFIWENEAGDTLENVGVNFINASPGIYTLTVNDTAGCSSVLGPYTVPSTSGVTAAFTTNLLSGQSPLTINLTNESLNATNYLWQMGQNDTSTQVSSTYIIEQAGQFEICLIAYNNFGCSDTACTIIEVDNNVAFILPNIFSPNNDKINDIFTIEGISLKSMDAEIFNRWGEKVSEWHTPNGGWDGRTASGLESPNGTYYYIIKAIGADEKKYFEKGYFLLTRDKVK